MWKKLLDGNEMSHYINSSSHNTTPSSHNQGGCTMTTYKSIWETLSKIDVSEHIEKKGNLSYLSWAWAWGTLMGHYPNAKYINSEKFYPDGSCEVRIDLDIDGCDRLMWLAVMDHSNKAIQNPNARSISDSKMRCLVKAIAMFGLGHYIYAGEDTPESNNDTGTSRKVSEPVVPARTAEAGPPPEKKKPAEGQLFSFTVPEPLPYLGASAKQLGYLRVCLVKAGKEVSPAFEVIGAGDWPSKGDVSSEIQELVDEGYGGNGKPSPVIPIPPSNPDDELDAEDMGLPF